MKSTTAPEHSSLVAVQRSRAISWLLAFFIVAGPSWPEEMVLHFSDLMYDQVGTIDLTGLSLQFDGATGRYDLWLFAHELSPFEGDFRINVNLYNGRLGPDCTDSFFSDQLNDFTGLAATRTLRLSGQSDKLLHWQDRDLVVAGGIGPGVPDCASEFSTGVFGADLLDIADVALVSARTMPLSFGFTDPFGDEAAGAFDAHAVNVQFDPATGVFHAEVAISADAPASGGVGLVANAFNPDLGTACGPALASLFASATVTAGSTFVEFAASQSRLAFWSAGQRVGFETSPFGNPDCTTSFSSRVRADDIAGSPADAVGESWRHATIIGEMTLFSDGFESGDTTAWSAP